jgi:dienelactone hydrolase
MHDEGSRAVKIEGFDETLFSHDGQTRDVYRRGKGPAVVVIHEIPGILPEVIRFAARVADAGFSVFMPNLFGTPGRPFSMPYAMSELGKCCVSKEFRVLASREASPITEWLRALARFASEETHGGGVGAIGMCLTGNFALAMTMDEVVMAPVLSQPSLPFPIGSTRRRALHLSDEGLVNLKRRANEGLKVLGLRFTLDPSCPAERFDRLREEIGSSFEAIEIDSAPGNPYGIPKSAHSVVTKDLVDEKGHPTREALDRVIAFFKERLAAPPPTAE